MIHSYLISVIRLFKNVHKLSTVRTLSTSSVTQTMPRKKLIIVGDGACGKTSLLTSFTTNQYSEYYIPTIIEIHEKEIYVEELNVTVNLTLNDTAGEEDYDRLRPLAYPKTDIVLICFSVDNPTSLENVQRKWAPEIKHFLPNVPKILVATKLDIRDNLETIHYLKIFNQSPVSHKTGARMAKRIKADDYIECSAKTMFNVRTVFQTATRLALEERSPFRCVLL